MNAHPSAPLDEAVFETVSHPLRMRMLEVVDLARPTPRLVRVTLAGDDFDGFVSASASDHVKLFVPDPGERVARVPVLGPDGIRPDPNGDRPIGRDYTPRHHQLASGRLEIDIVLHPGGRAASWAETAAVGDVVGVAGPRGSRVLRRVPRRLVLVGDETGLPAIHNFLLGADASRRVDVVASVADAGEVQPLETDAALGVAWIDRAVVGDATASVIGALAALDRPGASTLVFVAGEASMVSAVRGWVRRTWEVPSEWIDARGYWKQGAADHQEPHDD